MNSADLQHPMQKAVASSLGKHRRTQRVRPRLVVQFVIEVPRVMFLSIVYGVRLLFTSRDASRREELRAAALKDYLLRLGPMYIKAGQVLGTQYGLLSKQAIDELRPFFSDLYPMSARSLERALRDGLSRPIDQAFARFERQPIAVGSVAQVHRAILHGDRSVAVKIVKRGVRERLEASCWFVGGLLRTGHRLSSRLRQFDLPGIFAEIKPLLTGQCDMLAEAQRQIAIRKNFTAHPFLRIPVPIEDLCSEDVLVMDFFEGIRGQDFKYVEFSRQILARRLQDAFYCMIYFHGQFHVDPHPGNILFGREGQIMLLDFGLVAQLSEDDRWNLVSFYYACVRHEWKLAGERFTRAFVIAPQPLDDHRYKDELERVLQKHFEHRTAGWSTMVFVDDASRLVRRHEARMSTRFSLLALALLTGEGFISQIDPQIDIWNNARRFTDRFSTYLSNELWTRFEQDLGSSLARSIEYRRNAQRYLVAPTHLDRYVLPSAFPLIVKEAEGSKLRDVDGNEYIDLSCGFGPHILGYAHPVVVRAVQEAVARGGVNALASPNELRLAELIAEPFQDGSKVIFCNSGTEAVLMAIRMARAYTKRDRVAKFEGHYHGFSDQGLVSSWFRFRGNRTRPEPIQGSPGTQQSVVEHTLVLQYGVPDSLERIEQHGQALACVIVEPMPSVMADFDQGFLRELKDVCERHAILLIFDEVVTGFRVCYGGVQHLAQVYPDVTCLGKVIGGGLPCGAVVGRPEIIDIAKTSGDPFVDIETKAFVGGTMSGNSITCAAGLAVLEYLRAHPYVYEQLDRDTTWLTCALQREADARGVPCDIKGNHSIFSITFDYARPQLIRDRLAGSYVKANIALAYYMRRHGVYLPELHTLMLSAAHTAADLKRVSDAFGASLTEMIKDEFFTP